MIYGIFKIPLIEYGVSIAVGAMLYLATKTVEFGVIGVMVCTILLRMFRYSRAGMYEGFADADADADADATASPTADADASADADADAVAAPEETVSERPSIPSIPVLPVTGAASPSTKNAGNLGSPSPVPSFAGSSTPASASPVAAKAKKISEKNIPPANQPADLIASASAAADGFADSNGGLFKLGQIPTDEKGGFHIDAGTSVLNALKSLKPDQISAMTQDTKQLIDTQKTLMNMLQSFKPMLSEGKDMMDTFQQMFSPSGGSAMGALQAAQGALKN